jgi:UDP-glucose 4-epimerase
MSAVLVTGGSGFIGRYVVEELRSRGHTAMVLDRHRRAGMTDVLLGDVRDGASVSQAVAAAEAVIHLAGVLGTQETIARCSPSRSTSGARSRCSKRASASRSRS